MANKKLIKEKNLPTGFLQHCASLRNMDEQGFASSFQMEKEERFRSTNEFFYYVHHIP